MNDQQLTTYEKQWAEQAQAAVAQAPAQSGTFISTRGGILSFGEEELPGNQCAVIILDMVKEHTYYPEKFNPDVPASPICYAFARGDEEMAPHESMRADLTYFKPQSDTCMTCKHNEWGSADTGRGKACQNRERLALIPAGYYTPKKGSRDFDLELFNDPKHFEQADVAFIKLPVTSVAGWWKYVSQVSTAQRRPPHGVITRLFLEPDPKSQYKVHFEMIETVSDELAMIVMARHEKAVKAPMLGYSPPKIEDQPMQRGSLKGLRRGR